MNSITLNGTTVTLSQDLLKKQAVDMEGAAEILGLHARKLALYAGMEVAEDFSLSAYGRELRSVEYALQRAWGFAQSEKYHRFWEAPRCTCPKMDNEDRYPSGSYVVMTSCPVHGDIE